MLVYWIWFAQRTGVSGRMKVQLLQHFPSAEDVYFAKPEDFSEVEGMTAAAMESLQDKELDSSQKILEDCMDLGIEILTYARKDYPNRLRQIPDPPMVLYYKGTLPDFDAQPVIGIVGTRKASLYGMSTAKEMGYQIASCGALVVSGMAVGIDGCSMEGALMAGKPVVGILGCGADVIYPNKNRNLLRDTERYGCLLTEFPPKTRPMPQNFPQRNRILSGLSCGVLVVEAPEKSGALITAQLALDQGRDVYVVPSNIGVSSGAGSNALMRQGAEPVGCGWDVVGAYAHLYPGKVAQNGRSLPRAEAGKATLSVAQTPRKPEKKPQTSSRPVKKDIDNGSQAPYIDFTKAEVNLTGDEKTVYGLLAGGKKLTDDLIAESGLPAGKVLTSLTMLQIKGLVRRLPGNLVEQTGRK